VFALEEQRPPSHFVERRASHHRRAMGQPGNPLGGGTNGGEIYGKHGHRNIS
jgi:hypothetical protein